MMINELPQTYEGIAETFFENPDDRSQFRKVMLNNMKESTGIDPDITNEAIAETLNEDRDEDLYQGIEKGLMIDPSDPETRKNMLSNMETIGKLSRVYPNTAIEELFSDDYLSKKIATDDVFLINATNTNTDYPVYISRWNMFATRLLDRLNQDDPSLWSITKRAVTPMLLGAVESIGKKAAGKTFLAHGLTAAYDVSQLGNSIYNTQRDFNKRLREIMDNKDLDSEQYVQEIENLLDDVQQVPEEYRYEIYNSLWRGPDPYADAGLSFTGLGPIGIIHGMSSLKANITRYLPSFSSQNVKHLVLNDELGQKIADLATNASNEEKAIEKVTAKVTENQPKDAPESEVAVAKGIAINEDSDKNLRPNSNKDGGFFNWLRSLEIKPSKERSDQRGKISFEEPKQSYYIDHGKGVNNDPMTYEEAARLVKQLSGRKVLPEISTPDINVEPDYVAISTASKVPWGPEENSAKAKHLPRTGEGTEMYGSGIYASFVDDNEASRAVYYKNFKKELENEYIKTAKDKNVYAIDNPYFWYKNAQSTLTKEEKGIIDAIANSDNKDLLDYDVFNDIYKGIDFNTQLVASEGTLKSNLDFVEGTLEEVIKEFKETPSSDVAQSYIELIAERNMLEKIIKYRKEYTLPEARLYTHSIKNPNKYPENYFRFYVTGDNKRVGKIVPELKFHNINVERFKEQEEWIKHVFEKAIEKKNEEYWRASNPFMQEKIDEDIDKFNEVLKGKDYDIDTWYTALKSAYMDYYDIGIDGLIHSDTNIVIFNKNAVMPVNKLEKGVIRESVNDIYSQIGYDNAHLIVSAGDGVGYYVRELHGVKDAKPMIVENEKVIDFGDYKEYNPKK